MQICPLEDPGRFWNPGCPDTQQRGIMKSETTMGNNGVLPFSGCLGHRASNAPCLPTRAGACLNSSAGTQKMGSPHFQREWKYRSQVTKSIQVASPRLDGAIPRRRPSAEKDTPTGPPDTLLAWALCLLKAVVVPGPLVAKVSPGALFLGAGAGALACWASKAQTGGDGDMGTSLPHPPQLDRSLLEVKGPEDGPSPCSQTPRGPCGTLLGAAAEAWPPGQQEGST